MWRRPIVCDLGEIAEIESADVDGAPFRTIIASKDFPLSRHFRAASAGPISSAESANT